MKRAKNILFILAVIGTIVLMAQEAQEGPLTAEELAQITQDQQEAGEQRKVDEAKAKEQREHDEAKMQEERSNN